jgi:hypothetical protein
MKSIYFLGVMLALASCESNLDFDSDKWKVETGLETYPYRERMLHDIVDNKRLGRLRYKSIIDSLGRPENYEIKNNELWYLVKIKYGTLDPVYTKHLVLTLNADSTIKSAEVREWRKWE